MTSRQMTEVGRQMTDEGGQRILNGELGMRNEIRRIWETEKLNAQSSKLKVEEAIDRSA